MRMILIIFQKNILGKWTILDPKVAHCHNSGSSKNFLKFCTMKRANRQMKVITVCTKKNMFITNRSFWSRKWHILITRSARRVFFKVLQSERGQQVHESFISCCSRKTSIQIDLFSLQAIFYCLIWHVQIEPGHC